MVEDLYSLISLGWSLMLRFCWPSVSHVFLVTSLVSWKDLGTSQTIYLWKYATYLDKEVRNSLALPIFWSIKKMSETWKGLMFFPPSKELLF